MNGTSLCGGDGSVVTDTSTGTEARSRTVVTIPHTVGYIQIYSPRIVKLCAKIMQIIRSVF